MLRRKRPPEDDRAFGTIQFLLHLYCKIYTLELVVGEHDSSALFLAIRVDSKLCTATHFTRQQPHRDAPTEHGKKRTINLIPNDL